MENAGTEAEALDLLDDYVSETIHLSFKDTRMKQQFAIYIMEIASRSKKPIVSLRLDQTFNSCDVSSSKMYLNSGLVMPLLPSLKELQIAERGRRPHLDHEETVRLLKYAISCKEIETVRFSDCFLPFEVRIDPPPVSQIDVTWTPISNKGVYTLNLKSGKWQKGAENPITHREYQSKERTFQNFSR